MTVTSEAAEEIRKAMKKEKHLLISTARLENGKHKLKEYELDLNQFTQLLQPLIGNEIIIMTEFINRTAGETSLNAEIADYVALNNRVMGIINSDDTSTSKIKRIGKAYESFDKDHAEQEMETAMLIGTVDK